MPNEKHHPMAYAIILIVIGLMTASLPALAQATVADEPQRHSPMAVEYPGVALSAAQSDAYSYPETPSSLLPPSGDASMSVPADTSDSWLRVAHEPQADETCEGEWEKTLSHKSWRCIEGFWHQVTDEQWTCEASRHHLHHSHQQRTQDAC